MNVTSYNSPQRLSHHDPEQGVDKPPYPYQRSRGEERRKRPDINPQDYARRYLGAQVNKANGDPEDKSGQMMLKRTGI